MPMLETGTFNIEKSRQKTLARGRIRMTAQKAAAKRSGPLLRSAKGARFR